MSKPVELIVPADVLQVTEADKSSLVPFVRVPMATNCCVAPEGIDAFTGVTAIEERPVTMPLPERLMTLGLPSAP